MFENRRRLYLHQNLDHQKGEGENLKSRPWDAENEPHGDDKSFKEVFEANKRFILEGNTDDEVQATVNIPLNNDIDIDTIISEITDIAQRETRAFKVQFSFGFILRHVDTGDFRYFIPDRNETVLNRPFFISTMADVEKLRRELEALDLMHHLLKNRKDTKWKLFFLSNMKIYIFKTSYLLGNAHTILPDYIEKHQSIHALTKNRKGNRYDDNLCAFRCLALQMGRRNKLEETAKKNFQKFMAYMKTEDITPKEYPGIPQHEIHHLEKCFGLNINIFEMKENGIVLPVRKSLAHYKETLNMNLYKDHLSFIANMKTYSKKYQCPSCERCFPSSWRCLQHSRRCSSKTKFVYPGGFHHQNPTIFELLDEYGIHTDEDMRYFQNFIVFDFEAVLCPQDDDRAGKLKWEAEHQPISVSVCSNVEGFQEPRCFVDPDCETLIQEMLEYMQEIAETSHHIACEKWEDVSVALQEQIATWEREDEQVGRIMLSALRKLERSFNGYCEQIPVLGFNSSNYDLNLVKKHIATQLRLYDSDGLTIKKNNSYTCISNSTFKFLDISNYLAAGTSYSAFLKAYGVEESKGHFPYQYLTDPSKLDETELPPIEAFHNTLKDTALSKEDYLYCQQVWRSHNMQSMRDFLIWYNNLDVGPFVKAVEKLQEFYFEKNIDIFKVAMTVPGIARQMLFKASKESGASFALFADRDKDLFKTVKNNIIGGPSIIFKRHAKAGETLVRDNATKPCGRIVGYDANALYLWALNQNMPTGTYVRRLKENDFRPEARDKYASAYHWMDWLTETTEYNIRHKLNYGRERRIGPYPVDGFCSNTSVLFNFHGCYHHSHLCEVTKNVKDKKWHDNRESNYQRTLNIGEFIRERGYTLVEIWECQFNALKKSKQSLRDVIDEKSPTFFRHNKRGVSEKDISAAVKEGRLFGMIEVDIRVPQTWPSHFTKTLTPSEYFGEMSPLFCTTEIPFEAIGHHMQQYVRQHGLSEKPRRLLVGGMKARKLLIASPLLQWYLRHGLEVTNVYQVVEYTPAKCFQSFVSQVTEARREGDSDPDKKAIADTNKTIGNSAYGGLIMDKTKHTNIKYVKGESSVLDAVNHPEFINFTRLVDDVYEIEKSKGTIRLDLPITLGYFILQYAKLRMLEFYYDFMDTYCDRSDFQYSEMDTDSAYMLLAGNNLLSVIKPEMRERYVNDLMGFCHQTDVDADSHWFPRECCPAHAKRDSRTPGLFKLEFEGTEIIGLSSKTYIVVNSSMLSPQKYVSARNLVRKYKGLKHRQTLSVRPREVRTCKFSCKGISKRSVKTPLRIFKNVLETGISASAINKGFRAKDNTIFTYQQERSGFTYFYCKREVLDNGRDTRPLDIVLCPEKQE